jgi:hypothetical protein
MVLNKVGGRAELVVEFNNGALGFIELEQKSTGFPPVGFGCGSGVPIMLPADSAIAFDDPGDCDSDIRGGVFSVKSEYRPNLEFEHAIWPAPAFQHSA